MTYLNPIEKSRLRSLAKSGDLFAQGYEDHDSAFTAIRGGVEGGEIVAKYASTGNLALSGLLTPDGVAVAAGEIVLAKDQSTPAQNGLYIAASGAWARLKNSSNQDVLKDGLVVVITHGTANHDKLFLQDSTTPTFTEVPSLAKLASTAGAGLVGILDSGLKYAATDVEGALAEVKTVADAAAPSSELASVATGKGASLIGVEAGATTVEASLASKAVSATLAATTAGAGASLVGVEDALLLLAATHVEGALAELAKYIPIELADPGTGVAIPVTRSASVGIVTAGAETNTLAAPTFMGQKLILYCDTYVGDRVVTSAVAINQAGNTIMTFGAARDAVVLEAVKVGAALQWLVTANDGVALS